MSRTVIGRVLRRLVLPEGRGAQWTWWLLAGVVGFFFGLTILQFQHGQRWLLDVAVALVVAVLSIMAAVNAQRAITRVGRQREESETFTRILRALSRSVSPDAIVDAIVAEVGSATRADHVAVVRLRPGRDVLEATLVSMRPGSPTSNTLLPARLLNANEPHGSPAIETDASPTAPPLHTGAASASQVAERIAHRIRVDYGVRNTLTAPLRTDDRIVGAIVLSRRIDEPWAPEAARLLESAATETGAALSRVYSQHDLELQARTDELTNLPNRRYFDEYCTLVAGRRRATDHVAVLSIDVDHFKRLNDLYGHPVGDEVLRAIGSCIQSSVRDDDVPARYGGEEFVVLLRNPAPGVAYEIGERIRLAVRSLDLSAFAIDIVTVSVGVAAASGPEETIASVVERADRALYAAKAAGRDCVIELILEPANAAAERA